MEQKRSDAAHKVIWAKFVAAVENEDFTTTRAMFDSKQLGDIHAWDEFRMAADSRELTTCLRHRGGEPLRGVVASTAESIDDLKTFQERGLDLKRSGHLLLQDFANRPEMVDYILAQGCDINETDCRRMYDGVILPRGMFDFSNHLLDKVAALGNVELFDYLVARGADPQRSSALHRVSVCHGKQKSLSMLSSLIDRHKLDISANLYEGYNDLFDYGPENGTPLCSAVYNHNLPVAAELLRRGAKNQDLTRPVQIAIGGYCGIEYQEPALILLIEEGGFDFQRVLSEAVGLDQISAAKLCLERGADASHTLREQILEDELSLAQDLNPPSAVGDIKYHRKMSDEMRALLEQWKSRVPGLSDNTK